MNLFANEYQDSLDFEFGFNGNIDLRNKLEKKEKKQGNSGNFFNCDTDEKKNCKDNKLED